jgi:hypothetical protein
MRPDALLQLEYQRLKPLDLLCLSILERLWYAAKNGRCGTLVDGIPWVRVTASDMVELLSREGLDVKEKTAQRALKRLGDCGRVRREQRYLKRWDQRTWYAPLGGQVKDVTQSERDESEGQNSSNREVRSGPAEGEPVDHSVNNLWINTSNNGSKDFFVGTGEVAVEVQARQPDAGQTTVNVEVVEPAPTRDFQEIVRRCNERSGGALSQIPLEASRKIVVGGRVRAVNDGVTSPLR